MDASVALGGGVAQSRRTYSVPVSRSGWVAHRTVCVAHACNDSDWARCSSCFPSSVCQTGKSSAFNIAPHHERWHSACCTARWCSHLRARNNGRSASPGRCVVLGLPQCDHVVHVYVWCASGAFMKACIVRDRWCLFANVDRHSSAQSVPIILQIRHAGPVLHTVC